MFPSFELNIEAYRGAPHPLSGPTTKKKKKLCVTSLSPCFYFKAEFGSAAPEFIIRVPGRVNLIGSFFYPFTYRGGGLQLV